VCEDKVMQMKQLMNGHASFVTIVSRNCRQ